MSHANRTYYSPIHLPGITLPGNVFLAPLAGYTDRAFRELCRRFGASFVYTEMVSAEAVARNSPRTLSLLERGPEEDLLGIQIFLSEAEQAVRALARLLEYAPSLIDINCGCPVPKVTRSGAGAALMRSPDTVYAIVKALTDRTDIPVSIKIRSGWDDTSLNYMEVARAAEKAGASMVGLHARTKLQGYSGHARWDHIRSLTEAIDIPVIGSGDLFSAEDAARMLRSTGCAGVMFARGAIGNPSLFEETVRLFKTGKAFPDGEDRDPFHKLHIGKSHLMRCVYFKGERLACKEMKKHLSAYTRGLPAASALRNKLMQCETVAEFVGIIETYLENNN